jgi:hypothetical protein
MKTILRRKDNTSIFCPTVYKQPTYFVGKTRVIKTTIAFTLIVAGLCIMIFAL